MHGSQNVAATVLYLDILYATYHTTGKYFGRNLYHEITAPSSGTVAVCKLPRVLHSLFSSRILTLL